MRIITFLLLFTCQVCFAQKKPIDKVVNQIKIEGDTMRAIFAWVTDHIRYDIGKLRNLEKGVNYYKQGNYKNVEDYKEDLLKKVIRSKKGVCDDYTLLFDALAKEYGYTSCIVEGITKGPKGKINKNIGHSWNAVKVNGVWKLYDPTWGAGYVKDGSKFVKKYNEQWYDVAPEDMKAQHLPFDPIWQLSANPMTYAEFEKGKQGTEADATYNVNEMIAAHLAKDKKERMIAELERLEASGGNIGPIRTRKKHLSAKISNNDIPALLERCKNSINVLNEYMTEGKAKRFAGKVWTVDYAKTALIDVKSTLEESIEAFQSVKVRETKSKRMVKKNINQSKKILKEVKKELAFLETQS